MLFHEVQIGQSFQWRNVPHAKVSKNHAVPVGVVDSVEARVHIPSHDAVEDTPPVEVAPALAPPHVPKRSRHS